MSTVTNRTVNIYINHDSAQKSLVALEAEAKKLETAINKGRKAGKDMTAEVEKLGQTRQKMTDLQGMIDGKLAPSFKMVQKRVNELRKELQGMSQDAPGYAAKFAEFNKVNARFQEMRNQVTGVDTALKKTFDKSNSTWGNIKQIAAGTLIGNLVMQIPTQVYQWIGNMISGNARLSDSLADIRKATGMTTEEVTKLNAAISKIDTRTKASELREIAVGLGQIGEAATAESIANIDKIVVALGDEFGGGAREITTTLGTLRNNLHDIKSDNYGADILYIGNALNVLGAEGLATAPVITDFANRMSGIAGTFGATSGQILGLAAALQELGVPVERGSTAVIKLLQKITSETGKYANLVKVAGMDANAFVKQVNEDVVGALVTVAAAARKAGADNQTFGKILKDLDADGAGAGEVLSKLASNEELLASKINLASEALTRTNSITEEFNGKNNNLAGTLEKIQKKLASAFMNSSIMAGLESMVNAFGRMIGVIDGAQQEVDEFLRRADGFRKMEKDITPLIEKIDELQSKTALSADEQTELKKAIDQVADTIPAAITQFDEYGRAISVSTTMAKEYLRIRRLILQEDNADLIQENEERLTKLTDQLTETQGKLNRARNLANQAIERGGSNMLESYNRAVVDLSKQVATLQDRIDAARGRINMLKGDPLTGNNAPISIPLPKDYKAKTAKENNNGDKKDYLTDEELKAQERAESKMRNKMERIADMKQRILAMEREVQAIEADQATNSKARDEQEIARIKNKYVAIMAEARKLMMDTAGLEELQQREMAALVDKQFAARSEKEYQESLAATKDFFDQQKQIAGQAYADGITSKQDYSNELRRLEVDEAQARVTIAQDYANTSKKAASDLEQFKTQAVEKGVRDREALERQANANRIYALQYAVLITRRGSEDELEARIAVLNEQYRQEIEAAQGNTSLILLLEKQREEEVTELKRQHNIQRIQLYLQMASTVVDAFSQVIQALNAQTQAELENDRRLNNEKKKNYEDQLNKKRISKAQYDKLVEKADAELARKERAAKIKEFKRNQAISLGQAVINGAMAITSIWAQYAATPYIAAILTAIAAAANGIQIGVIAGQKPPQYAKGRRPGGEGGVADGPSHAGGGIKMVTPDGQLVGEMEGDEAILSKDTYRNNPELVNALLDSSMYRGGKKINWYRTMPSPIAYDRVASSMSDVKYATGRPALGSMPGYSTSTTTSGNGAVYMVPEEFLGVMQQMMQRLDQPLEVPWTSIRKKQQEYEELQRAGSMNRNS